MPSQLVRKKEATLSPSLRVAKLNFKGIADLTSESRRKQRFMHDNSLNKEPTIKLLQAPTIKRASPSKALLNDLSKASLASVASIDKMSLDNLIQACEKVSHSRPDKREEQERYKFELLKATQNYK